MADVRGGRGKNTGTKTTETELNRNPTQVGRCTGETKATGRLNHGPFIPATRGPSDRSVRPDSAPASRQEILPYNGLVTQSIFGSKIIFQTG